MGKLFNPDIYMTFALVCM